MSIHLALNSTTVQPPSSIPVGKYSQNINELREKSLQKIYQRHEPSLSPKRRTPSLEEILFDTRANCKIKISQVAMYLTDEWRTRFFTQLDNLMDIENWEEDESPVTQESFSTLLRMLILIKPIHRPGLGSTSNGNIVAAWTRESDRLTIECLPNDSIRWVLSRMIGDVRESAAGKTQVPWLLERLETYNPNRWFNDES